MQTVGRLQCKQCSANSKVQQFCSVAVLGFELSVKCRMKVCEYSLYSSVLNAAQLHVSVQINPENFALLCNNFKMVLTAMCQQVLATRLHYCRTFSSIC